MNIAERNRIFLAKLQSLPDQKKKIILWTIVIILAVIMGFFWLKGAMNTLSKISESAQNIKIPQIDTSNIPAMPSLNVSQTVTPSNK